MTQKEIKLMPCEDITAAGDERLAEIRREGIAHTVWSYGVYGKNAGLIFTDAGKVYKITARSSNIFAFR